MNPIVPLWFIHIAHLCIFYPFHIWYEEQKIRVLAGFLIQRYTGTEWMHKPAVLKVETAATETDAAVCFRLYYKYLGLSSSLQKHLKECSDTVHTLDKLQ